MNHGCYHLEGCLKYPKGLTIKLCSSDTTNTATESLPPTTNIMLAAQTEPPTPDTSATILDDSMTTETPGLTNIETSTMTASSEMEKEVVATSKGEGEFSMQCDQIGRLIGLWAT